MSEPQNLSAACRRELDLAGRKAVIYSLPALAAQVSGAVARMPVSLRIVLESLLRNCDGQRVHENDVRQLAGWKPRETRTKEIPFVVGRIVLQDVAGIPLLCDLAAMRAALAREGHNPSIVRPQVPVDMVIDHTVSVDYYGTADAIERNMALEFRRNDERFRFVKWAMQAYPGIKLIPPGYGILHQINLEYFGRGVLSREGVYYPDTLVGTDSHTCMIAGLGVVGWGVGGIEAEAAMLGQPIDLLTPDVVGMNFTGALRPGVTATDLVLHVTERLRKAKVVGKFVEFCGDGVARLSVPDRATLANMAVEYGATIGYFPYDEQTSRYLSETGRDQNEVALADAYYRAQGLFGTADPRDIDYSELITLDLGEVVPCVAGPKRPQDRIPLDRVHARFSELLAAPPQHGGYGKTQDVKTSGSGVADGQVLIAAITSCTNTSNPALILAAGLLARNALQRGLRAQSWVKTSLTPGSKVVGDYLRSTGLQQYLDALGFNVAGYGCATCVGNSGPLDPAIEQAVNEGDVIACAVLSGNRNFEARIHPAVRAAFLMSPPLVVAYALAGTVIIDFTTQPLGHDRDGRPVMLAELWPTQEELQPLLRQVSRPEGYRAAYRAAVGGDHPLWTAVATPTGPLYGWEAASTYIKEPPYFQDPSLSRSSLVDFTGARALAILGDSVTTDHISPIGTIKSTSPAGRYLTERGVSQADFNNYGSRRMNHEVMVRGTFANVRLRNLMCPDVEGGMTAYQPSGELMAIYDAAMRYAEARVPLVVVAGEEYGTGSARDWAAKGTRLLGVRAVIANSFERIHRSNLVGMGVLPCQLPADVSARTLGLDGSEEYALTGVEGHVVPRQRVTLAIRRPNGSVQQVPLTLRLDTMAEIDYARRGGILPYVLDLLAARLPAQG